MPFGVTQRATVQCEAPNCTNIVYEQYSYSIMAAWILTGGARMAPYVCEHGRGGQHFGCSPEHAMEALMACLKHDEHMSVNRFNKKREEAGPRVSEEDGDLDETNPSFHIAGQR